MKTCILNHLYILLLFPISSITHAQSFYQEVPFEELDSKMYVEVNVNGKPYRFLVDTGVTGYGRIDSAFVADEKIPITGSDTNFDGTNRGTIDQVMIEQISFAGISFENVALYSRNLNRRANPGKDRNYGIIGQRFWQDYVMEVDFERKKIIFSDTPLSKEDTNTVSYKRSFIIPFKVGEIDFEGHLDTGSPFTILFPTKYTKEFNVTGLREVGRARSAYTTFTYSIGTITDKISIANNTLPRLTGVFSDIVGHVNIGMAFLRHYNFKIDQKNGLIKLQKFQP